MDLGEFFGDLMDVGSQKGGWKSWWAIFCLVLGAGVGGWVGYASTGVLWAFGGAAIGGFLGWVLGVMLKGVFRIAAFVIVFTVIIVGFQWMTGTL